MTPYTDRLNAGHYADPAKPKTKRESTTTQTLSGLTDKKGTGKTKA